MGASAHGKTLSDRLWSRVKKSSGCWMWQGYTDDAMGYGMIWEKPTMRLVHRVAWELKCGPIPHGMNVLHKCDVPACVNPRHLWLGTHQDNMADMVRKGRGRTVHGEANNKAKLTEKKVRKMRAMYESGVILRVLAMRNGISIASTHAAVTRQTWKHVA